MNDQKGMDVNSSIESFIRTIKCACSDNIEVITPSHYHRLN